MDRIFNAILMAFALSLGLPLPASAETLIYEDDLGRIELAQAACPLSVATLIREDVRDLFKGAMYTNKQELMHMVACWFVPPNNPEVVYLHFIDNDYSFIPLKDFKKAEGI